MRQLEGREADAGRGARRRTPTRRRSRPAIAMPQGTVALVGRTLLVLAGAYVARALTDARRGARRASESRSASPTPSSGSCGPTGRRAPARRESAVFHAMASSLIAFPLVWEATARFGLLGPRAACAALVGLFALGLGVAWRQRPRPSAPGSRPA